MKSFFRIFHKKFLTIWNLGADKKRRWRLFVKLVLLILIIVGVLFPNPVRLIKQIQHYNDTNALIQPDSPYMANINSKIDSLIQTDTKDRSELDIITRFVIKEIKYNYDWNIWKNVEYWPTASEVWQKHTEDCDGQAILLVSILHSRGYKDARLVANFRHVWVQMDSLSLMDYGEKANIDFEKGKMVIQMPSWKLLLNSAALSLAIFPGIRYMIILYSIILLLFHPAVNIKRLLLCTTLGSTGFIILKDWAESSLQSIEINFTLLFGAIFIILSIILAATSKSPKPAKSEPATGSLNNA